MCQNKLYLDHFTKDWMIEGELLVQLEAIVHGVQFPDQLMTLPPVALVRDDQDGGGGVHHHVSNFL
jgi:hypothetical protein